MSSKLADRWTVRRPSSSGRAPAGVERVMGPGKSQQINHTNTRARRWEEIVIRISLGLDGNSLRAEKIGKRFGGGGITFESDPAFLAMFGRVS